MKRLIANTLVILGAAAFGAAGWIANDYARDRNCSYTANGYGPLYADLRALPEYPLESVSNDVVGEIQKCWAAHPYVSAQHVLLLTGARKSTGGGYYLIFEPWGTSDLQLVFLVDANRRVKRAYNDSTV